MKKIVIISPPKICLGQMDHFGLKNGVILITLDPLSEIFKIFKKELQQKDESNNNDLYQKKYFTKNGTMAHGTSS